MNPFYKGQKVVCVIPAALGSIKTIKEQIYTCAGHDPKGEMLIKELPHPHNHFKYYCAPYEFFRPLKDDVIPYLTFNQIKSTEKEEVLILN